MKSYTISLIGAGAVGGVYAMYLQDALGKDSVRVVMDKTRKERHEREGLTINGRQVFLNAVTPDTPVKPADLVIIATKNLQLEDAAETIASHVGPHTAILSLLNGIESEQYLASRFGAEKVLYSFVVGIDSSYVGKVIKTAKLGTIVLGEVDNTLSDRVIAVHEILKSAGLNPKIPQDIHQEQWWKFMLNVGLNTLTALTFAGYGDSVGIAEFRAALQTVFNEVRSVAKAEGINFTDEDVARVFTTIEGLSSEGKTSMLQDFEAGRPTENRWFCGTVAKLGKAHKIPVPVCDFLTNLTAAAEQIQIKKHHP